MANILERLRSDASELWALPWRIINDPQMRGLIAETGALTVCVNISRPFEVSFYLFDEPFLEQHFHDLAEAFRSGYTALYNATRVPAPRDWRAPSVPEPALL